MDKLCLIFIKFGVSYFADTGNDGGVTTTDIISIREIGLKEATEIKKGFQDYDTSDYQLPDLDRLKPTSYNVEIIKDKASIKTYKKCFDIKNGSYNSTNLDLVDIIKKYILYKTYENILDDVSEIEDKIGNDKNSEFIGNLLDLLSDFYFLSGGLSYQEFKSDQVFLDIVNDIENIQGTIALPSVKEEMATIPNYENELIGIIGSYLEPE